MSTWGATGVTVEAETAFVASEMLLERKGTSTEGLGAQKVGSGQLEGFELRVDDALVMVAFSPH